VSGDVGGTIDRDDVICTNAAPICRRVGPAGVGTSTNFDKRFSYAVTVSRQNEIRVETGLVHGFRQIWDRLSTGRADRLIDDGII
jgi:hypothetical protein